MARQLYSDEMLMLSALY